MIERVQRFKTSDGNLFEQELMAQWHENLLMLVKVLKRSILPEALETCDFSNGDGFIQLTREQVQSFVKDFQDAVALHLPGLEEKARTDPKGFIGRYLDDSDSPLYEIWCMIRCIDKEDRLWGQQYYAFHPNEGKQHRLNP